LVSCGAKHKFLSVEPLLEELPDLDLKGIDLVIVGGESGDNSSRPVELDWILKVKKNCDEQGVPFFFKQWGMKKFNPDPNDPTMDKRHRYYAKGGCMINSKIYLSNPSNPNHQDTPTLELFGNEYYIMDDYSDLKTIWELKSYLPFMEDDLYEQLKSDIKQNGLNDPILFMLTPNGEKLVIEGHTRLRACIELKLKNIPTKEVKENFESIDDIKLWMVRHQFQRRNLSSVEKIELALLSRETIEKMAKDNLFKAGKNIEIDKSIDTYAEIAKIAGVGRTSVFMYSAIMDKASDSVKQKLRKGDMSITSAYDKVKDIHQKKRAKPVNKANNYKILNSIEEGQKLLAEGKIQGVVLLKNKAQIDMLNNYVKTRFGLVITES
jgi:ParB family chromosome partitioning protein